MSRPSRTTNHDEAAKAALLRYAVMSAGGTAIFVAFLVGTLVLGWFDDHAGTALIVGAVAFVVVNVLTLFGSGLFSALQARAKDHG